MLIIINGGYVMNNKDKPHNCGNKKITSKKSNDIKKDKLCGDKRNTKGDGNMENVIRKEIALNENKYKEADNKKVDRCLEKYTKKYNKALRNLAK